MGSGSDSDDGRTSPTATCLSCGTEITGSIFMFNDARYCCERHRLTAVYAHMEARSQKKRGSFNSNPANGSLPERPLQQRAGERVFYTWV